MAIKRWRPEGDSKSGSPQIRNSVTSVTGMSSSKGKLRYDLSSFTKPRSDVMDSRSDVMDFDDPIW